MPEYVTTEQFQLYIQAQENKNSIKRIRSSLPFNYGLGAFSGVSSVLSGLLTAGEMRQDEQSLLVGAAVLTAVNVGAFLYNAGAIVYKNRKIGRTEAELEAIIENPAYKELVLVE